MRCQVLEYIAPVAQLDRASAFEAEGREFESLRARHSNPHNVLHLRCNLFDFLFAFSRYHRSH